MRLWLNHEVYVEIDEEGYCRQHPLEGAMGFIIPSVRRQAGGDDTIAWKIPRLLADTRRENTYIEQALGAEYMHVRAVAARDPNKTMIGPLLSNPFVGTVRGVTGDEDDYPPDGTFWLLVSFSKDRPPRFCCMPVEIVNGEYTITEGDLQPALRCNRPYSLVTVEIARRPNKQPAPAMVGNSSYEPPAPPAVVGLIDTISQGTEPAPWYLGIASLCYEWAQGTLQEAIDRDARGAWSSSQHYRLIRRLLEGLEILHQQDHIHGDLRPANIMYRRDEKNPSHYCITDYGSFATGPGAAITGGEPRPADQTVLEAITALRVSPYYAPERRSGREDENADAAIFLLVGELLVLIVGWRTHLLEHGADLPTMAQEVVRAPEAEEDGTGSRSLGDDVLRDGDRVRLRDFVFDVVRVRVDGPFRFYVVSPQVWVVVHERLLVPARDDDLHCLDLEGFETSALVEHIVSLSRVIELPQWTSASDLYAVGAIALRSVFPHHVSLGRHEDKEPKTRVEHGFRDLLETLANPLYAQIIWKNLDFVCQKIEERAERARVEGEGASAVPETRLPTEELPFTPRLKRRDHSLLELAFEVCLDITSTVPQADRVLKVTFQCNTAKFLLFIHFTLCCIHRNSVFRDRQEGTRQFFAESRIASGAKATRAAIARVELLHDLCAENSTVLQNMQCEGPRVTPYVLRSSAELTLENLKLAADNRELSAENRELSAEKAVLSKRVEAARETAARLEGLIAEHDELRRHHEMIETAARNQRTSYRDIVAAHNALTQAQTELRKTNEGLEARLAGALSRHAGVAEKLVTMNAVIHQLHEAIEGLRAFRAGGRLPELKELRDRLQHVYREIVAVSEISLEYNA